jgi:hypothetical protein
VEYVVAELNLSRDVVKNLKKLPKAVILSEKEKMSLAIENSKNNSK